MLICRFVYLLQALSALTQQMLVRAGEDVIDQRTSSIGLVVKQFCNRQVQLNTVVQQTMSDVSQYATNLTVTISTFMKLNYHTIVHSHSKKYPVCTCTNIDTEEASIKLKRF